MGYLDIALASIALHQGKVQQQASIAVMKKAMDQVGQQGDTIEKLMGSAEVIQHAAQPHLGGSIDLRV